MVVLLHISEHSKWDCLVSWHSKQANRRCLEMVMQLITRHGVEFFGRWCGEEQPQPGRIIWTTNTWFLYFRVTLGFLGLSRCHSQPHVMVGLPHQDISASLSHWGLRNRGAPGKCRSSRTMSSQAWVPALSWTTRTMSCDGWWSDRLGLADLAGMAANWLSRPPREWTCHW